MLSSKLCAQEDWNHPWFDDACRAVGAPIRVYHRKNWEHACCYHILEMAGMFYPGRRGLGFAVGRETLPAAFAARGCTIVATDKAEAGTWGDQHCRALGDLFYPDLCPEQMFSNISFRPVDMNLIPSDLRDFDFIWSSCSFEHIGGIEAGLQFVMRAMDCLKPGGIAVHTTEINLSSDTHTYETPDITFFRKCDMIELDGRLHDAGHHLRPIDWHRADIELNNEFVENPPADRHINVRAAGYDTTSMLLIIRKAG